MPPEINYFDLLSKYIKYLNDCEGTDFINPHDSRYYSDVKFTETEWKILNEISILSNKIKL